MDLQQQDGAFSEKIKVAPQHFQDVCAASSDCQTDFTRILKKELLGRAAASSSSFQLSSFTVVPQMASGSAFLMESKSEAQSKDTQHASSFIPVLDPNFPWRDRLLSNGSERKSRLSSGIFDTSSFIKREREGDIQSWKSVSSNFFQKETERLEKKFLEKYNKQQRKYIMLDIKNPTHHAENGNDQGAIVKQQQQQQQIITNKSSMSVVYEEKYLGNGEKELQLLELNPQDEEQAMFQKDLLQVDKQSENPDKIKIQIGKNEDNKYEEDSVDTLDTSFLIYSQPNQEEEEPHRLEIKPSVIRQDIGRINHQ